MPLDYKDGVMTVDDGTDVLEHALITLRDGGQYFAPPFEFREADAQEWRRISNVMYRDCEINTPNAAAPAIQRLRAGVQALIAAQMMTTPKSSQEAWHILNSMTQTMSRLQGIISFLRKDPSASPNKEPPRLVYTRMLPHEHVAGRDECRDSDGSVPTMERDIFGQRAWSSQDFKTFLAQKGGRTQGIVVQREKPGMPYLSVGYGIFTKTPQAINVRSAGVIPLFRALGAPELIASALIDKLSPSPRKEPQTFLILEDSITLEHPEPPHRWAWEPSKRV